jgi:hypothetical protein
MGELCAGYSDDELVLLTDYLTKLGTILDQQTERLRTAPPD